MRRILDITVPLSEKIPVWPGTKPVQIVKGASMEKGDEANTVYIHTTNHVGTHMDAPRHFVKNGATLDELPLELVCGRAKVIEVKSRDEISVEELKKAGIEGEERVLIRSRMSSIEWWKQEFITDFVHLSDAAAEYLVEAGVKLIGVDYLSVSGYQKNEVSVHKTLLGNGIWIIEGLRLAEAEAGYYELCCLPLKLQEGDGAPCRAILKSL